MIGVQFMVDWTDIEASRASVLFPGNTLHAKLRGFGTLTGRLGYVVTPSFLLYGKFGWGAYSTNFTVENTRPAWSLPARTGGKTASILASAASG